MKNISHLGKRSVFFNRCVKDKVEERERLPDIGGRRVNVDGRLAWFQRVLFPISQVSLPPPGWVKRCPGVGPFSKIGKDLLSEFLRGCHVSLRVAWLRAPEILCGFLQIRLSIFVCYYSYFLGKAKPFLVHLKATECTIIFFL